MPTTRRLPRNRSELRRRPSNRRAYDKVLIVCEGATERAYFTGLIDYYKLSTANIRVKADGGSSPKSILEYAEELSLNQSDPYDRIYCVFDKDSHHSYSETLMKLSNKKRGFYPSNSVPCFEYWILLHFQFTTRPFQQAGNKSACDMVLKKLRNAFPEYDKRIPNLFSLLADKIDTAKKNAIESLKESERGNTDNPSTKIHQLVDYLQNLKN